LGTVDPWLNDPADLDSQPQPVIEMELTAPGSGEVRSEEAETVGQSDSPTVEQSSSLSVSQMATASNLSNTQDASEYMPAETALLSSKSTVIRSYSHTVTPLDTTLGSIETRGPPTGDANDLTVPNSSTYASDEAEGAMKGQSSIPAEPEQYMPMPLPDPGESGPAANAGQLISYDIKTGSVLTTEATWAQSDISSDSVAGGAGARAKLRPEADTIVPASFSDLGQITNPEAYPWSAHVKLFIDFNGVSYVGSGVLIDPLHVLTAGHNVYSNGTWATSITVVPAYDNGTQPFGSASADELHAWAGWTVQRNYDHDLGIIDLDRPIGALAGWLGYGYNNSSSFYTGSTFYSPGFPAEGPYNGQLMYSRNGSFDTTESVWGFWWYGNEVGINKPSYDGQDGSGAYYFDGTNRYVYAALSNGNSGRTNFTRITSDKFFNIQNDYIGNDTPSTFDLIPLDVEVSLASIDPGSQLPGMSYVVHNYSSAAWSGAVNVDVYLSPDDSISTADRLIQRHSLSPSLGPMSSVLVDVAMPPTIPVDVALGEYWIGVILNVPDHDTGNNASSGQDAASLSVTGSNAPRVDSLNPPDDGTNVLADTNLMIDFSEAVQKGTGNIVIRQTSDDSLVETIAVSSGQVTISGDTVTIDPSLDFAASTGYYVLIDSAAFADLTGDAFAGISDPVAWNFVTREEPNGEIHGSKWNDLNGNGLWDSGEPGLAGWTIYLDVDLDDVWDLSTTTAPDGSYSFTGLASGTYRVGEEIQPGWEQTYPGLATPGALKTQEVSLFSTTASDASVYVDNEIVLLGAQEIEPATVQSTSLINMDAFRSDPRFTGIDGSSYSVVVIDTGIDLNHPFFGPDADANGIADRIVYQYDFANSDNNASDQDGHGSNVSSVAASEDATYMGMAPGANIVALKVFTDAGDGNFGYVEQALQWVLANAVAYNIASVNMSLSDSSNWTSPQSRYGIGDELAALAAMDVIVVSSSGNGFYGFGSAQGVGYPSADPNSLSVGAVYDANTGAWNYSSGAQAYSTAPDRISPFSQRHSTLTTVLAPGAVITGANHFGGTVSMHGTSQAAPHITGIVALAQQLAGTTLGRRLTPTEFADLLASTGVMVNDGDDENDNVTNTGLDFPRVDMLALAEGILALGVPGTHTVALSAGQVVGSIDFGNEQSGPPPENDAPVADDQSVSTTEDASVAVTLTASDADGDPLTYSVVNGPTNGGLTGSGANLTYAPNPNYNGPDSFTFRANDGLLDSNTATVSITISAVPDAPVADSQSVSTSENTAVAVTLTASDGDGDPLTYSIVNGPTNGGLTGNGANLTYTPNPDYNGPDSFTFKANDGLLDSNTATVSITISAVPDPDPMTWATLPYATSSRSIAMVATTATNPSDVEYYFENTSGGGHDSGWQGSPSYEDTGLQPDTQYGYRVKARNKSINQNETAFSDSAWTTTHTDPGVDDVAASESTIYGGVNGNYTNTHGSDGVYESIQEAWWWWYGYLEHRWVINVSGGAQVTFFVEAFHTGSEDFSFGYSTNGWTYAEMLTVSKTSDDNSYQSYELPSGLSGPVYIRAMDTLRWMGDSGPDRIYIDHMYIRSVAASPSNAPGATREDSTLAQDTGGDPDAATDIPANGATDADANQEGRPRASGNPPYEHDAHDVGVNAADSSDNTGTVNAINGLIMQSYAVYGMNRDGGLSIVADVPDLLTLSQDHGQYEQAYTSKTPTLAGDRTGGAILSVVGDDPGSVNAVSSEVMALKQLEPAAGQPDASLTIQASNYMGAGVDTSLQSSGLAELPIALERIFAESGVVFATERPGGAIKHSTVYVEEE